MNDSYLNFEDLLEKENVTTVTHHLVGLLSPNQSVAQVVVWYGSLTGSAVCALGFITSLICVVVFAQAELSGVLFKYYLTESVLNTLCAFINVFLIFIYKDWSSTPPFKMPEQVALWNLIFFDLVTNFCTFGSSILNIAISLDRYLSIINKRNFKIFTWKYSFHLFMVIMVVLSFVCSAPRPIQTAWLRFFYDKYPNDDPIYDSMHTVIQWVQVALETVVRDIGTFVTLNILNLLLIVALRRFIARKKNLTSAKTTSEHKSEVDITKMVIYNTLVYFLGRIGSLVYHISVLVPSNKSIGYYKIAQYNSLGCSCLFNIFIYYYFNKAFKKNFIQFFGRWTLSNISTNNTSRQTNQNSTHHSAKETTVATRIENKKD